MSVKKFLFLASSAGITATFVGLGWYIAAGTYIAGFMFVIA